MCGRYTLTSVDGLVEEFRLVQFPLDLTPRYNIAPTQAVPVVDNRPVAERTLTLMRWGLVPRWAKDPAIGNKLINARAETVAQKPAFRDALKHRRCLVVADGFYEWKPAEKPRQPKTPYFIHRADNGPMAFAGLWERWKAPDSTWMTSCTIITTNANDFMAPLHDRMPVIVQPSDYDRWLSPEVLAPKDMRDIADILAPAPSGYLSLHEVSRVVNSPKNDVPECIEPAQPPQPILL